MKINGTLRCTDGTRGAEGNGGPPCALVLPIARPPPKGTALLPSPDPISPLPLLGMHSSSPPGSGASIAVGPRRFQGTFHASFRFVESTSTARTSADHHDARVQQQCLPERQRRRWCLFFASSGMSLQHNVPLIIITTILSHDAYTGLVNGAISAPCLGGCVGAGGVAPRC